MIECPKCHFVQPKDRYCANCGIDMENFQAKPPPLLNRITNSPLLYVFLFVGSIAILAFIIATQPDSRIARTAKWVLSSGEDITTSEVAEEIDLSEQVESSKYITTETTKVSQVNAEKKPSTDKTPEATTTKMPETMVIEFAELPRAQLESIYSHSQILAETAEMQVMTLNKAGGVSALRELEIPVNILNGGKNISISKNPTQVFNFVYSEDDGEDYGLSFQVTYNPINAENISIDYEVFLNLKGGENLPPHNSALSGSYQFKVNSTLLLSGILPRQKLSDQASQELEQTPLSIMNTDEFTNPDAQSPSEFIILISVK